MNKVSRRDFFKIGIAQATGVAMLLSSPKTKAKEKVSQKNFKETSFHPDDLIARMENDVKRAMNKAVNQRSWVMVMDLLKCVGCNSCTISCKTENITPPGVAYNVVMKEEIGHYPHVRFKFTPKTCMHCRLAPCISVCPVHATYKREDGIIAIDYDDCIGCRYCLNACPYNSRFFDKGDFYTHHTPKIENYEKLSSYEYGKRWKRVKKQSPVGNARKCHFCLHRLEKGLLPSCIVACMGRARYFGDMNDTQSLVAEVIGKYKARVLKEELGTEPSVYYID